MLDCGICEHLTFKDYHRWLSVLCVPKFFVPGLNKFVYVLKRKKKKKKKVALSAILFSLSVCIGIFEVVFFE